MYSVLSARFTQSVAKIYHLTQIFDLLAYLLGRLDLGANCFVLTVSKVSGSDSTLLIDYDVYFDKSLSRSMADADIPPWEDFRAVECRCDGDVEEGGD